MNDNNQVHASGSSVPATKSAILSWLFPLALVIANAILVLPEALVEKIYPWDDSLYAANGAFFLTIFQNLSDVLASPMAWMTEYYRQYPALFVRRQPPLFGVVESGVYGVLGVSAVSAKLTVFLFSTLFVVGWYLALLAWTRRHAIAFLTVLLTITLPMTVQLSTAVRVDIPALAPFAWALYVFRIRQDRGQGSIRGALLVSVLLACSLYTYQLPMFSVVALFLFWLISEWPVIVKRVDAYVVAGAFAAMMIPLVAFTLKFAYDNVAGVVGPTVKDFEVFTPVTSKLSPQYWLYYAEMAWNVYRIPTLGLIFWIASKLWFPIKRWEWFFLSWLIVAYLGFSLFPSKGDRYAYYFVLAILPLASNTVVDLWDIVRSRTWAKVALVAAYALVIGASMVSIPNFRTPTITGMDRVAKDVVSNFESGNVLYHGRFESTFIYYLRREDRNRNFRVLRSGNEIADPASLEASLAKEDVKLIVVQEPIDQKGGGYAEIYQPMFDAISRMLSVKDPNYTLTHEYRVRYGVPGSEKDVAIRIFTRTVVREKP